MSVGISTGATVSAGSSTEIITILGTNSYEVEATLNSSQIPSVKVGQTASVEVDGVDGNLEGTVSQVGPVQSGSSGYSYPVIVALPASLSSDMHSGSSGNVTITTGSVSNVPRTTTRTSAVSWEAAAVPAASSVAVAPSGSRTLAAEAAEAEEAAKAADWLSAAHRRISATNGRSGHP